MQYGICPLSLVSLRNSPEDTSEMISQLLFGEHFKILESRKYWSRIRVSYDKCEGWIPNNQLLFLTEEDYDEIEQKAKTSASDLIGYVERQNCLLTTILVGSSLPDIECMPYTFEGNRIGGKQAKNSLIDIALLYLNSPELKGGKSPFGIDASGFTQMVYKINGYELLRTSEQQSTQGEALSFVEESEAGDLAFFDDASGSINHVGIIMENNYIIHVNGTVRIDRLDHTGIFNNDLRSYSHQLRVIKKIV
ncbi:NlpC/P60 family protein [Maribacter sp. PR1]|uniref:NlpC/P60 family protein n=1 Tax=Maribacter cobaltidurans TaxID=1178778 RepID=A0ABU7IWL1_9FLAO|nr:MULTISPECIES: NlpC/P60 family protein [Maribacter]MDC6389928.1 NlpC/P60 family protein [Maribacter sp. PR1]MEE1977318.1 NlpC/P60 family protein [Maribacter cobaltidurans]